MNTNDPPSKENGEIKKFFAKNFKKRVFIQNHKNVTLNEN